MRISRNSKKYFYFSLEQSDWNEYGYMKCRQFLNAFQKEFKGGKNGERFWIAKMKAWAVLNSQRQKFDRLYEQYLGASKQKELI